MKHYYFVNGQRVARLPQAKPQPPAGIEQLKWLLRAPYDGYGVDARKRLWHLPYTTAHGRKRGWQLIRNVVKNGYDTYTLRKDGKPVQLSRRQLLGLAYRNPDFVT
ncbi:hypothetical protein LJ737_20010 [Hymenobacter sp. 15J16-1T3B]|uniref:hypothetical protein n=1 Tax=Hymenobacter sp. 15J16-1T3B TaxID=2886941 RepID=UPI001D10B1DD|nr:hypothetical protein [Hymenobacter sp. 15J16-1T3B]MCC3159538.1 hypothetical protein [Hymenobacter sp. 15J16-1T3B]